MRRLWSHRMIDCQPSLFAWGNTSIAWIAEHLRHAWLSPIMLFFSGFGKVGSVLFTIAIAYWCWHKRHGKYLCYGMFAALFVNLWLKGLVKECRPPSTFWMEEVHSYSFPSGHAQIGILLWWGLAYYVRSRTLSPLFLFIGLMIALARPYMGVHYPQDIIAGGLLGIIIIGITIWFEKKQIQPLKLLPLWGQSLLLIAFFALFQMLVNDPEQFAIPTIGACFGFWLGCQLEEKYVNYTPTEWLPRMKLLLIGSIGILLFWKGINLGRSYLSSDLSLLMKYPQYALLGFWISYGAPRLMKRSSNH